ncbi:hypothetical protein PISMIDRAFT_18149 [Pisolithus microcarpus 441]|uniref:Uncharacterized protein n=1 Tax=Pisolithus microcarpus 441 TaxID=765257 RepID=A0A0C9XLI3_9AGAM|nr:hypothetical protein PISMIDRAFT_18149 [Pisolithus microcarpus 441]
MTREGTSSTSTTAINPFRIFKETTTNLCREDQNPRAGDVSDTDQEPDLPSELGSALGDQDIEIHEPHYEIEVERFASRLAAMTTVKGQSSAVPHTEINPNPGQSEQLSTPASHPTDPHRPGLNGINGGWEFNVNKPATFSGKYGELCPWLNQVAAYLTLNAPVYMSDHVKIGLALSYMTTGVTHQRCLAT